MPSGRYHWGGWTADLSGEGARRMASVHEAWHDRLQFTTIYGLFVQHLWSVGDVTGELRWTSRGATAAGQPRPPAANDVAMPPQDRPRSNDQPQPGQAPGWQRPGEQGQPRPVRPRQPRMNARPLAQGDSELMAQYQDLGVLPPRLPARQAQQQHGTGNDQEDQLQAHKPKIIPPPAGPRPARRIPNA